MAQKPGSKPMEPSQSVQKQVPNNVVALNPLKCVSEDCKKKPSRAGFCDEHFVWFKEGLITASGMKARDFDKKYHDWLRRSAA